MEQRYIWSTAKHIKKHIKVESVIKIQNLIFEYQADDEEKPLRAIDDISLEIEKGSFVAIIGKNGSGKSTLAKNLNGLLVPTSGKVIVNGFDTSDDDNIWNIRQSCGMVFQNPDNQLVSAIVEDDVAFGPENLGVPSEEIKSRVDKALADVRMCEFRNKAPHLLSGGQKQRIAIAGVIAMKPSIIVFDEPTAMLDPKGRRDIMSIIDELHKEGITVVLITHFMEEAVKADRAIIMHEGKILADGTPEEVFTNREILEKASLDLPLAVELGDELRKKGINVPKSIVLEEDLVNYLSHLAENN